MKKNKNFGVMYLLFFIAALFFGVFVLIEFHGDYLAVAGAFFIILITAYLALDKLENDRRIGREEELKAREEEHLVKMEYFTELEKVQKASYVALKKNTAILDEQFLRLSEKAELISEQTKLLEQLRTYVKKDTEQTAAMLQVLQSVSGELKDGFKLVVKYNKENAKQVALNTNEQIAKVLKQLENLPASGGGSLDVSAVNEQYDSLSAAMFENSATVSERLERLERVAGIEDADEELTDLEDESDFSEETEPILETESMDMLESETEPTMPITTEEPALDPNKMMGSDDIAALLASMGDDNEEKQEESVKPAEPAPDPNKMMGPDDIAALLASMGDGNEEKQEEEPVKPEEPASDPNKMMGPDDIAALLASMGN